MSEAPVRYPSGKKGICINCQRYMYIADKDGFCGTCHEAVENISPDSVEYPGVLAAVKQKIAAFPQKSETPKPPTVAWGKNNKGSNLARDGCFFKGIPEIIAEMRKAQEHHLAEAEKLSKAIDFLTSL